MSVKEEILEKSVIIRYLKETGKAKLKSKEEDDTEKGLFKKVKRTYRIIFTFLFFLSIILIFMILPMVIAAITQDLWR